MSISSGEFDAEKRLGIDHIAPAQTEGAAELEPVLGMRLARFTDQILAFFFDGFGEPHPAHLCIRAVEKDGVFLRRHVLDEVITLLGPALELRFAALAFAEKSLPGMRRPLMIVFVDLEEGFDEILRG